MHCDIYNSGFHIRRQGGLGRFKINNGALEKSISIKNAPFLHPLRQCRENCRRLDVQSVVPAPPAHRTAKLVLTGSLPSHRGAAQPSPFPKDLWFSFALLLPSLSKAVSTFTCSCKQVTDLNAMYLHKQNL